MIVHAQKCQTLKKGKLLKMNKKIIFELDSLYRDHMRVTGYEFGSGEKSACIVGAMRGNEMQQLYCCSKLIKRLKEIEKEGMITPGKSILVIPCVNSSSMNIEKRFWGTDNTDINRMFPGYSLGETTQRIAGAVFDAISDYTYGMQFVSSYVPGKYIPHIRMMKTGFESPVMAAAFCLPYVVIREPKPYDTTTLNYNWQLWNCHAFSIYTDATEQIHEESATEAVESILRFLKMGNVLQENTPVTGKVSKPEMILESEETIVKTKKAGFLRLKKDIGMQVKEGEVIAEIIHTYEGNCIEEVKAPKAGTIFYICQRPVVYSNFEICKII